MLHRFHRIEIGADRQRLVAAHLRVERVWHRRVEPLAAVPSAVQQRVDEIIVAPRADPSLAVRCDVRRQDLAKRGREREPAGIGLAARLGVAAGAVAEGRKIPAIRDLLIILPIAVGARPADPEQQQE